MAKMPFLCMKVLAVDGFTIKDWHSIAKIKTTNLIAHFKKDLVIQFTPIIDSFSANFLYFFGIMNGLAYVEVRTFEVEETVLKQLLEKHNNKKSETAIIMTTFHKSLSMNCIAEAPETQLKRNNILDAYTFSPMLPSLPLKSFNHIAREVISLEKSRAFYCSILGFQMIPRPPFDCEGYWLWGYGLSLHLVETSSRDARKEVLRARAAHFSHALPRVDHIAFVTDDMEAIQRVLDGANVFYKKDNPSETGISQIFFFDPDGNVIEVSNCAPEIGQIRCSAGDVDGKDDEHHWDLNADSKAMRNSIDDEDHKCTEF